MPRRIPFFRYYFSKIFRTNLKSVVPITIGGDVARPEEVLAAIMVETQRHGRGYEATASFINIFFNCNGSTCAIK